MNFDVVSLVFVCLTVWLTVPRITQQRDPAQKIGMLTLAVNPAERDAACGFLRAAEVRAWQARI